MEWLDQNIDAYRIVSEILGQLRIVVRAKLEKVHGEEWYRRGLPEDVFERLVAAKEREKSIDWYEDQYQQIMEYVTFADIIEILLKNAEHFPEFVSLAPSEALLHARFLELDVMRSKLGSARPISETELSFLGTFHLRFRKAVAESEEASETETDDPEATTQLEQEPEEETAEIGEVFVDHGDDEKPSPVQPVQPPSPPKREVVTSFESGGIETASSASSTQDHDEGRTARLTPPEKTGPQAVPDDITSGGIAPPVRSNKAVGPKKLNEALASNDHRTVLRELYREVTAIAEGVWSSEVTPNAMVWEQVTASDWYEINFSRLGLQPLSVFYEVTEKVDKKVRSGASRQDLQEYLKETNFAKTLLALRDMFQANDI